MISAHSAPIPPAVTSVLPERTKNPLRAAREALPSPSGVPGLCMSRQELADAANAWLWKTHQRRENLSEHDIGRYERGEVRWPRQWRRKALRGFLGVASDAELGFYPRRRTTAEPSYINDPKGQVGSTGLILASPPSTDQAGHYPQQNVTAVGQALESIRTGLIMRGRTVDIDPSTVRLGGSWADARAAHDAYQRANYAAAAQLLPGVVAAGEHLVEHSRGRVQQRAHRVLALVYIAVSKLAAKLGDGELAWIAADRAAISASFAEDQVIGAVADYQIACALAGLPGRLDLAAEVLSVASDKLNRRGETDDPMELSARGALLLLGAIVAARNGDRVAAAWNLHEAERLARRLGHDGNHLFTGFGPTNLLIHRVSAAVELHRPGQAIEIGERLDTSRMPVALVSRRVQVHVDLASAYAQTAGGDSAAVVHLLEVERIAPQVLAASRACRTLLMRLITRERRTATPGLRALVGRAGVST